jgi:hypothetical protein
MDLREIRWGGMDLIDLGQDTNQWLALVSKAMSSLATGSFSRMTQLHRVTQNYWGFGYFTSSGIMKTREHDVSETGYWICFRPQARRQTATLLGPSERVNLNPVIEFSETLSFLVLRIQDDGQSPNIQ